MKDFSLVGAAIFTSLFVVLASGGSARAGDPTDTSASDHDGGHLPLVNDHDGGHSTSADGHDAGHRAAADGHDGGHRATYDGHDSGH